MVAVWDWRGELNEFVAVQAPVLGSKISISAREVSPSEVPPATSTVPLGNKVALWLNLALFSVFVAVQVPSALYNSTLETEELPLVVPPATSTCPVGSNVAVCA